MTKRFLLVLVFALVGLSVAPAQAQDRVLRQIQLLGNSKDFRVRTQAALALGSSRTKRAVGPLCSALNDSNTTVRIASAAALGKLQLGGKECLEQRLSQESSQSVKATIGRALAKLGGDEAAPSIGSGTKYYVAIGKLSHTSGRSSLAALLRSSMVKMSRSLGAFAIAPAGETTAAARTLLRKHSGVKGFLLAPKLTLTYGGGRLTAKLDVAMLSYPEKNMIGSFTKTAASPGVSGPDSALEDELVAYAGQAAMKQFAQVAPSL